MQALKAAREGGSARAGIGRLPQKRTPAGAAARPVLGQQKPQGSSAAPASSAAEEGSAAPPDRQAPCYDLASCFLQMRIVTER